MVIAVISVLVGILLPALSSARTASREVVCKTNLRQMGLICQLYADSNGGESPALGVPWGRTPFWALVVQEGATTIEGGAAADLYREESILVCPETNRLHGGNMTRTYGINVTGLAGAPGDRANFDTGITTIRTHMVRRPADTPLLADSAPAPVEDGAPPPTRTTSVIDYRDEEHVALRLGRVHANRFHAILLDHSIGAFADPLEAWTAPLP